MASSTASLATVVVQTQNAVLNRQVITQTITYADYTTTAVVTLGPGAPSTAPLASPGSPQNSQGLSSSGIGIIIGSIAGAIVLALIMWWVCVARQRIRVKMLHDEYESQSGYYSTVQIPDRAYLRPFPHSIPPPVEPTYRAVSPMRPYRGYG
ncbi:hypothetical protein F5Y14DRAFT_415381 [Nemania sp. NC0429]|nr:hypothetical protein F5Y14DRAFT_415381 [Nemania sp. NC0429]